MGHHERETNGSLNKTLRTAILEAKDICQSTWFGGWPTKCGWRDSSVLSIGLTCFQLFSCI